MQQYYSRGWWWGVGCTLHTSHTHVTSSPVTLAVVTVVTVVTDHPRPPVVSWPGLVRARPLPGPNWLRVATGHHSLQSLHNPVTTDSPLSRLPSPASLSACDRLRTGLTANSWVRALPCISRPTAGHATALIVTCLSGRRGHVTRSWT